MNHHCHAKSARTVRAITNAIPEGCTPADARVLREANHALAAENDGLRALVAELERERLPNEQGKNRYGVDVAYFRNAINRELNRPLVDYKPDELARVLARLSVTADGSVVMEPEFQRPGATSKIKADAVLEACEWLYENYKHLAFPVIGLLTYYANQIEGGG